MSGQIESREYTELQAEYRALRALNAELLEALLLAREYVKNTHGVVAGAAGHNNLILPDLEKIDAAIAKARN